MYCICQRVRCQYEKSFSSLYIIVSIHSNIPYRDTHRLCCMLHVRCEDQAYALRDFTHSFNCKCKLQSIFHGVEMNVGYLEYSEANVHLVDVLPCSCSIYCKASALALANYHKIY